VYGDACNSTSITTQFQAAMANGVTDEAAGGQYYYDAANSLFWTWDTPALIARKFEEIVKPRALGGVMAWSLGEDGYDFSHILALQRGVENMNLTKCEPYACPT
jgi:chitinase